MLRQKRIQVPYGKLQSPFSGSGGLEQSHHFVSATQNRTVLVQKEVGLESVGLYPEINGVESHPCDETNDGTHHRV